jgi:hypothetical protein
MRQVYTGKELKKDFAHDNLIEKSGKPIEDNKLYISNGTKLIGTKDSSGCSVLDIEIEQIELSEETIESVVL